MHNSIVKTVTESGIICAQGSLVDGHNTIPREKIGADQSSSAIQNKTRFILYATITVFYNPTKLNKSLNDIIVKSIKNTQAINGF